MSLEIASEASYNILDWTDKLLPPGKKKPKSARASAASAKEPSVLKQLKKQKQPLPRPMPPLFKDDDDFELPAPHKEHHPEPVKISAADEIKRLMENLNLLCKVKETSLVVPFKKMLDSVSLIATVEQEEPPDLDIDPPDASILDHIFADMKINEKQPVQVIVRETKVVTKITPSIGHFAKRARFTSTPLRKSLPKRISAPDSIVGKDLQSDHIIIAESPENSLEEPVAAPIIQTGFEFSIALESDESLQEDDKIPDRVECPSSPQPVQNKIESSQETCFTDDLMCAAAEVFDTIPLKKISNSVSDIFKTSVVTDTSGAPATTNKVPDLGSDDDDEYFSLEAIDNLEKQHQQSKVDLGKSSSEEAHGEQQATVAVMEEDDEFCIDEDDLESKLNEIQQNALKKDTLNGPVVILSDDSNDGRILT